MLENFFIGKASHFEEELMPFARINYAVFPIN